MTFKETIKCRIKRHIEFLKQEQKEMMDIQTFPKTFHYEKLCLAIRFWDLKIAIWEAFI